MSNYMYAIAITLLCVGLSVLFVQMEGFTGRPTVIEVIPQYKQKQYTSTVAQKKSQVARY